MSVVIVASTNPVKVEAVRRGFERVFPNQRFSYQPVSVPSGVSDQPRSDQETLQGALNRARQAQRQYPGALYWAGLEGGVEAHGPDLSSFSWVVVLSPQAAGKGRSATFFLPPRIAELVQAGKELGEADDLVFNQTDSKRANGAVGILTGNVIDRAALYEQAVILALLPFRNPDLYPANDGTER